MTPWLKVIVVSVATDVVIGACAFGIRGIFAGVKADPFGDVILGVSFAVAVGLQVLALISAWMWKALTSKRNSSFLWPVIFAALVAFVALLVFLRYANQGHWSSEDFLYFSPMPIILCGAPLLYLLFCEKRSGASSTGL
jgi:hypothetical protein